MNPFSKALLTFAFACAALWPAPHASAKTLETALDNIAGNVAAYLAEKGQKQIMMGDFDGPGGATAGRAIRAKLEKILKENEITVLPLGSNWKLRGAFSFEPRDTFSIVLIKTELVDKSGKELSGFREKVKVEEVTSVEDITRTLGLTVDLRSEQNDTTAASGAEDVANSSRSAKSDLAKPEQTLVSQKVAKKVASSVQKPVFAFVDDLRSKIAADPSSPFHLELQVRRKGSSIFETLPIQDAGGFPFAPLAGGDEYRVHIHNTGNHAVGVKISIDGINTFALSTDPRFQDLGTWFVGPKRSGVIAGWYVDSQTLKSFLVTAKGDELHLPDASDLGTITAQFFHAWRDGEPVPAIELGTGQREQLRTTAGPDIVQQTRATRSYFGKRLLASVSIRYSNPDDLPPAE